MDNNTTTTREAAFIAYTEVALFVPEECQRFCFEEEYIGSYASRAEAGRGVAWMKGEFIRCTDEEASTYLRMQRDVALGYSHDGTVHAFRTS